MVQEVLKDSDWAAFHRLLSDRKTRIDDAVAWLNSRGYVIGRTAIANYCRVFRQRGLFKFRMSTGCTTDAAARRRLEEWAKLLSGDELGSLAMFAAFLVSCVHPDNATRRAPRGLVRNKPARRQR
jgi:hypothetical protein